MTQMSMPQIHHWEPTCCPDAVWHHVQQYAWCCIFDVGEWRIAAVAEQPTWQTQQHDWQEIPDVYTPRVFTNHPTHHFLSGTLSIVSFDGTIHAWCSSLTVAFQKAQQAVRCTQEQHTNFTSTHISEPPTSEASPIITTIPSNTTAEAYQSAVQQTRMEIEEGNVYQINLSHQLGPIHIQHPLQTWLTLMSSNPATHGCYWQTPFEVLICNSPEQFLSFTGDGTVQSTPIKGTHNAPNAPNAYEELLHSDKEKSELTMIVDMMRNDIFQVLRLAVSSLNLENSKMW